jgi:plastocyanin
MGRIILLMTVALGLVSTLLVVSAGGADKQPKAVASQQPTRTVVIQGFRFKPANITIKRGTRVRWINRDSAAHTATANNGAFNSGLLRKGETFSRTFRTVGKKAYHCNPHPYMRGSVVVQR